MDFKLALRSLLHRPTFTAIAVSILALGIGANTAIFSVLYQVVLRPLPYPHADRIVSVTRTWKQFRYGQQSGPDFVDYHDTNRSFAAMAAYANDVENVITNRTGAFAGVSTITPDFFRVFSVQPVAGRLPEPASRQAVLTEGLWRRRFNNLPWSPGHQLTTENTVFDITGIVPSSFHFPEDSQTEVWIPVLENLATASRTGHNYIAIGRLKNDIALPTAQQEMSAIAARIARTYAKAGHGVLLTPLAAYNSRQIRPVLYLLFGAVLLILFIACANVAGLLLARGTARLREFSIRAALGASFTQLTRQLFVESLLLSLLGCAVGILFASLALPALVSLAPQTISGLDNVHLNLPVLAFAVVLSLFATLACGLAPGLQAGHADPIEGLRSAGTRGSLGGRSARTRRLLVTAEIALCVVLLAGSGLLLRSFSALLHVNLGFNAENTLAAEISVDSPGAQAYTNFYKPLVEHLKANPANDAISVGRSVPGNLDYISNGSYIVDGQTEKDFTMASPQAEFHVVGPEYFKTIQIPFVSGRDFDNRDTTVTPAVTLVNESFAKRAFPQGDAIGKRILSGYDLVSMKWMRIVGIVHDAHLYGPGEGSSPAIFMPFAQHARSNAFLLVRSKDRVLTHTASVQSAIRAIDPAASVHFRLVTDNLTESVAVPRFISTLTTSFAVLAALLAAVGIYGLMSFSVTQRTSEIGVRLALGATRQGIAKLILISALKLTAMGFFLGLAGSFAATRVLKSQLFAVSASDPVAYFAALAVILAVALLASLVPAHRAARVEPIAALRQE